ncbi:hypothetical protein GCM10008941_08640 [Rhizomicrobium palustre]
MRHAERASAFQKFIPFAVLLPESFRGGCSFGLRLRLRPDKSAFAEREGWNCLPWQKENVSREGSFAHHKTGASRRGLALGGSITRGGWSVNEKAVIVFAAGKLSPTLRQFPTPLEGEEEKSRG